MEFNPNNPVIKLCLRGMEQEEKNEPDEAGRYFLQAWNEATNDFEKFTAAYYVARHQDDTQGRLKWLETSLDCALKVNNLSAGSALPHLYTHIAQCHEQLGQPGDARAYQEKAASLACSPSDHGPFYHGTRADLKIGDLLTPGFRSNYDPEITMNHIYFTALTHGAGLAAAMAAGEGDERVYIVKPTGIYENDPNVTDKKFPGNPTRSYRTHDPLKIVGELTEWDRQTPEDLKKWREKVARYKGDIIN